MFQANGQFTVHTSDLTLVGFHELWISASLVEHPSVTTLLVTIVPFEIGQCLVDIAQWSIGNVIVPALLPATLNYDEPLFTYQSAF